MINVNSNLKNAITGKGTQLIRITGSCSDTDGNVVTFTWGNADVIRDSFFVDKRCVSGSQFSLGNTVSNELGFEVFAAGKENLLLEGAVVTVSLGGYVSGVATYFEVGKFILDKPTLNIDRLSIKGYDFLTKLDGLADNWVMKTGGGENVLGLAIKPTTTYPMGREGWSGSARGQVTTPYFTIAPNYFVTGMVPFSQSGHFPQKVIIDGISLTPSNCYYLLFYYDNGTLTNVGGLQFAFDYKATVSQSGSQTTITFNAGTDPNKTALQEYVETNFGEHDYFVTYTLTNGAAQTPDLEIKYNASAVATIKDTVNDICAACGMQFFEGFPAPYNLDMSYRPLADYSKYSYRTILGLLAQACGANLTLWPSGYGVYNGQVRFAVPVSSGITLNETNVMECDISDEAVVLTGTRYVDKDGALYINRTVQTEPFKFLDFSGCPVFPIDAQTAVDNLSALTGTSKSWLPGRVKLLAMPWIEPMDIVAINYSVKPFHNGKMLVTRVHITADGVTSIESVGFTESTNSNGYVSSSYTPVDPFGLVYSSYSETTTPGTTSNVPLSTFPKNLPSVNDYVRADSGFGIVTAVDGSFATVQWLDNDTGAPTAHTHDVQDIYATDDDAAAIASGDALIFSDASDGGKLKKSNAGFTTSTSTYLRRNGTWGTPTDTRPSVQCETAAGTAAKAGVCTNYSLKANSYVHVNIRYSNTAAGALTLNVNSKGAKPIYINGNPSSASNHTLPAGTYIAYYDGTAYQFRTDGTLPGKIMEALQADEVPWTGIQDRPTLSYLSIDTTDGEQLNIVDI